MSEAAPTPELYYIRVEEESADTLSRVLKQGESFAILDQHGDIEQRGLGEEGIYHEGTRHVSDLRLFFGGQRALLLSSAVLRNNSLLVVDLMNPDLCHREGRVVIKRGTIHIRRSMFLWRGAAYVEIELRNHGREPIAAKVEVRIAADFADIFEIRGVRRARRGAGGRLESCDRGLGISYTGLDGRVRRTIVESSPPPDSIDGEGVRFNIDLPARGTRTIELRLAFEEAHGQTSFASAYRESAAALDAAASSFASVSTSNEQCDELLGRCRSDLAMMLTETPHGRYPYAGVPWFSTVFGRDGIITALQCLWLNPSMARGVLACLAATQASEHDDARAASPGKIVHEMRSGEMAALGEIPFGRYYGTIDATPLFIILAGAYFERTSDREFVRSIWPNILAACDWMEKHGDLDGDGFIEYAPDRVGLRNQGWKDSEDSIFHCDGSLAEGAIALCEVQAYAFAARRAAALLAHAMREPERAARYEQQAEELQRRFDSAYWIDEIAMYAVALDGQKKPCAVRSSNPGHCLTCGIVPPLRAARLAEQFRHERFSSGWGIRTIAADEVLYNPMSYHNGSVWPHDTAMVAAGLARYGFRDAALHLLEATIEASTFFELSRLPELFCGFARQPDRGPTRYPLACSPQSWAAGAPFHMLGACLGIEIDAGAQRLLIRKPALPALLEEVTVRGLAIGPSKLDLVFHRHANGVLVRVARCEGPIEVVVVKT
jgi:glycogen debranching enzyme